MSSEQLEKFEELKSMPDDEVMAKWKLHKALSDAAYRRLREIAAEEAAYNRRRHLVLAGTPEGKAEYDAQIASFRAAEVVPREAHKDACEVCRECIEEMQRRRPL